MSHLSHDHPIVLFDGHCNLCNGWVDFIIPRDPGDLFRFAASGSEAGDRLLRTRGLQDAATKSVVLIEGARAHLRSAAVLRIGRRLRGVWPLFWLAVVIPAPVLDWVYDSLAARRYIWFGRRTACRLPGPKLVHRFIL
jgi:predicted DCC family thiol-disulfide oxidoreductase YuxK